MQVSGFRSNSKRTTNSKYHADSKYHANSNTHRARDRDAGHRAPLVVLLGAFVVLYLPVLFSLLAFADG